LLLNKVFRQTNCWYYSLSLYKNVSFKGTLFNVTVNFDLAPFSAIIKLLGFYYEGLSCVYYALLI
jgi:hypothetical protein